MAQTSSEHIVASHLRYNAEWQMTGQAPSIESCAMRRCDEDHSGSVRMIGNLSCSSPPAPRSWSRFGQTDIFLTSVWPVYSCVVLLSTIDARNLAGF
jgi:hypothetical protein